MQGLIEKSDIEGLVKDLKQRNKTVVTTNGCFDILHAGHVRYLNIAKGFGDVLIVALNSDASVSRLKGENRPINSQSDRAEVLLGLSAVDYVVIFDEESPKELLALIKPDVHVKGGDYSAQTLPERDAILSGGGRMEFVKFLEGKSTSSIIEKLCK